MKVNIIGKGSGWEHAPDKELSWGITQLICRRSVDRVIDMNDYNLWGPVEAQEAEKAKKIADENNIEYISLDNYPLSLVIERFKTNYFGSTVDYAVALALFEGFDEIHLYGINMINSEEYGYQKPSIDFWCGYALGMGVKIEIRSPLSTIMRTKDGKLYGYGMNQAYGE